MPVSARQKPVGHASETSLGDNFAGDAFRNLALANAGIGIWQLAPSTDELRCDDISALLLGHSSPSDLRSWTDLLGQI